MKREEDKDQLQKEVKVWSELRHNNIAHFYGANFTTEPYFIVSESVETMNAYIVREKPEPKRVYQLMFQAAAGLRYLHSHNIVHGDLNGRNIGINQHGVAMLTLVSESSFVEEESGALQWGAPEFDKKRPTFAADVFSLGMCVIAAINGTEYPWCYCKHIDIRKCYEARGIPERRPHCMSEDQWRPLKRILEFQPYDRPDLDHVLEILASFASDGDGNTQLKGKGQEAANDGEDTTLVQAEKRDVMEHNDSAAWQKMQSWEFVQQELSSPTT
ncbi:hypothetical protein V7S43_013778 [Phytophthora oleae]|uniref:Protein kinase domain-containing protein n=1 Tax=Phytophthora oleae TaxID=2107226 RepID=A0ABD3F4H9_9STRA